MLSLSGLPLTAAERAELAELEVDPYTRDTFRAVVDAIVPETPDLEAELGAEHVPGGLEVDLETYVIYGLNNYHEVQAESLTEDEGFYFDEGLIISYADSIVNSLSILVRLALWAAGIEEGEDAFGAFERMDTEVVGSNPDTGAAVVEFTMETEAGTATRVTENYPYAELFALVFDLIALEFVARRNNEDDIAEAPAFAAGGLFARLSREDRLRCMESIIDGSILSSLTDVLDPVLPTLGIVEFAVMAIHGLTSIGYYSEWAGYRETGTLPPNERELQVPEGEDIQGQHQAGFDGFEPGYADHRGFEVEAFRENEWQDAFENGDDDDDDGWWWFSADASGETAVSNGGGRL